MNNSAMAESIPRIKCKCCGGSGKVQLPSTYQAVWKAIKKHPGIGLAELANKLPSHLARNNITNQLILLLKIGLITRNKESSSHYQYSIVTTHE